MNALLLAIKAALSQAFSNLWNSFLSVIPGLVAAIVVIFVGWIFGRIAGNIVTRILNTIGVDSWIKRNKLDKALWGKKLSHILGSLVKWYIILVFLGAATSLVKLKSLETFMELLVRYLPALLGATLIIILGFVAGEYVRMQLASFRMPYRDQISGISKFLIVYFALVIGLQTAGFKVDILIDAFKIAFSAFAISLAIVVGIGFGLAFAEDARKIYEDIRKEFRKGKKR